MAVIAKLHYEMFGNEEEIVPDGSNRTTYRVGQHFPSHSGGVRYTFASNSVNKPNIVVHGPMHHFVVDRDLSKAGSPLTGMIYSGNSDSFGVLGLVRNHYCVE